MAIPEEIIPTEVNLDVSSLYINNRTARFIRNMDMTEYGKEEGKSAMVWKPLQANFRFESSFTLPPGKNKVVGKFVSRTTNEVYVFVYNDSDNHCIYRIRNGKVEFVYIGKELRLRSKSRYFVAEGRCIVVPVRIGDETKTYLSFLNGWNEQCFICVEDSIATNYYDSVLFPRFKGRYDRHELIALGLREPEGCIEIKEVSMPDSKKINKLTRAAWQFRVSYVDVYGRPSEHGPISDLYYQSECASGDTACLDLSFNAGGPMVAKWNIEYRRGCTGDWSRTDTIDKYETSDTPWYLKPINKDLNYDAATNRITYRFCADKECILIPDVETRRPYNPMPITSEAIFFMAGALGLAGNRYGQKPFGSKILDKIKFSVDKPALVQNAIETRNITVWVQVFNPFNSRVQGIYKNPNGGRIVWGGVGAGNRDEEDIQGKYGQYFADEKQEGFIGLLRGTGHTAISKQYRYTGDRRDIQLFNNILVPVFLPLQADESKWVEHGVAANIGEARNNAWMQKFEFKNVRPGKYIFQIAAHQARISDKHLHLTSTYTAGQRPIKDGTMQYGNGNEIRELEIDVCEKDYNTFKEQPHYVQVWDLTEPHNDVNFRRETKVMCGYAWEKMSDDDGILPIEGADVYTNAGASVRMVKKTDHNGFYFVAFKDNDTSQANLWIQRKCKWVELGRNVMDRAPSGFDHAENFKTLFTSANKGVYFKNFVAKEKWPDYVTEKCNRILVKGRVIRCGTDVGISGVSVVISGGGATVTNSKGEYELIVHYGDNRKIFFAPGSSCNIMSCDNKYCLPERLFRNNDFCVDCNQRDYTVQDVEAKINDEKARGPQLGGRYGFSVTGSDWMGRKNFAQVQPQYYLDIPTSNELGGFGFPRIRWSIDPTARFPVWMKRLYFNWTKNLKYSDFHTWVVDRFEFIDNTGNVNEAAPSQIRIYYGSMLEYNKQHNLATNSTWQFIDEKDSLRITDTVQFVANGDNKLFSDVITEQVRFDKDGQYITVDYNPKLRDLKAGALIKLMRESECASDAEFDELCDSIALVDGVPERFEGYLNVYDSYYVNRSIPTPIVEKVKRTQTTISRGTFVTEEVVDSLSKNELKNYGWLFEHHSPSDKWGTKCANRGRKTVKNEYEGEIIKEDELALSGTLGTNSLVNYLHYFDDRTKKDFKLKKGMVVACIVRSNSMLVIQEHQSHVISFDDDVVRIGQNGEARVNTGEQQFGKPQLVSNYGCRLADRNTIAYDGYGIVKFLDTNNIALLRHNFQEVSDVSKDKFESFLRRKIKFVQEREDRYFHQHINPKEGQSYLTDFSEADGYVNNSFRPEVEKNETLCVDLRTQTLRKFSSCTPEMFASLIGDDDDSQFFSFKAGLPYAHHRVISPVHSTFFDIPCTPSIRIAVGVEPSKVKEYMAIEAYVDNIRFYAPEVVTEQKQVSEIPRNFFLRGHNFWSASFLCNKSTVKDASQLKIIQDNPLTEGDKLRGRWIEVLLVADPENVTKYFELTGVIVFINGVEKSGKQ